MLCFVSPSGATAPVNVLNVAGFIPSAVPLAQDETP